MVRNMDVCNVGRSYYDTEYLETPTEVKSLKQHLLKQWVKSQRVCTAGESMVESEVHVL